MQAMGTKSDAAASNSTDDATVIALLKAIMAQNETLKTKQDEINTRLNTINTTLQAGIDVTIVT